MSARVLDHLTFQGRPAIIPEVSGVAKFLGAVTWVVDPEDEIGQGFLVC